MTTAPSRNRNRQPNRREQPADHLGQIGRLFDRMPPHALEAEAALLGAMILDSQVIGDVVQVVKGSDDFYKTTHGAIYQVLLDLYDQTQQIDLVQVNQRLRDLNKLEEIGGTDYLIQLAEAVPSALSAPLYAKQVRDKAILRQLIEAHATGLESAYTSTRPAAELLDDAEAAIFRLAEDGTPANEPAHLGKLLQEAYDDLDRRSGQQGLSGLETGLLELDEMTCGMQNGEMIIIAARPSMGKTALATTIAEHVALVRHQPVAMFSLEMSRQQVAQRLMCARSGVDSHKVRRNMLNADEFARLHEACAQMADSPLLIDDTPGLSLMALRAKARRLAARHSIKLVLIDYLQLMTCPGSESRQQEVSELSRGVKALARELNLPVICLSQLNRASENREGHRPRMSDLRESGSIEQDADVVMMLHREDYYEKQKSPDYEPTNIAEVIVAKQRNGPTGTVKLHWDGERTRFNNLAHRQQMF